MFNLCLKNEMLTS